MSEVCRDTVWQSFGNGHGQSVPCGRTGKVYVDGKWYCGIHDPAAVEKRRKKSAARYAEQTAQWRAANERQAFDKQAGDLCRELGVTPAALRDEVARLRKCELDAKRYRRLQVLGCAPSTSKQLENGTVLCFTNLDEFVDADIKTLPSRGESQGETRA